MCQNSNQELNPKHIRLIVQHRGSYVVVLGCFPAARLRKFVFIEGIMNLVLPQNFRGKPQSLCRRKGHCEQLHVLPKQRSECPFYNCRKLIQTPSQSLDIKTHQLDVDIRSVEIISKKQVKAFLTEEWHKIASSYTNKLVEYVKDTKECHPQQWYRLKN